MKAGIVWVAALLASWLLASPASANSAPLAVSFEGAGQALPQAQIRVAIATELGRETVAEAEGADRESENRERVLVAVDELGQLWLRYWGPRGLVDRHLPMPAQPEQIPVVVSLSIGNMARQEAFELLRDIERRRAEQAKAAAAASEAAAKPVAPAPKRTLAPQPALPRRPPARAAQTRASPKNSWGHYLVGDFPYIPGSSRNCTIGSGDACYQNSEPISFDVEGSGRLGGVVPAHSRYVMAYSRALMPDLWGSLRIGFAFSGGDGKNAAAEHDAATSEFMPWLFEARLKHLPFRGAFGGALRPFVHIAAGMSEESGELTLQAPTGGDGQPIESIGTERITLIRALGLLFAGGGVGGSLALFESVRLEAELSGFVAFPTTGWFLRPAIGLSYDF